MDRLFNALKAHAAGLDAALAQPRFAIVASFDPTTYTARVTWQPEGVLSGWLPVLTAWSGAGWGLLAPPVPGQQVLVVMQEGEAEHGVILGGAYSATTAPPATPAGEFWLVHKSGSLIKLHNDGTAEIAATTITLSGSIVLDGNVSVTGNVTVSGNITDASGSVGVTG